MSSWVDIDCTRTLGMESERLIQSIKGKQIRSGAITEADGFFSLQILGSQVRIPFQAPDSIPTVDINNNKNNNGSIMTISHLKKETTPETSCILNTSQIM